MPAAAHVKHPNLTAYEGVESLERFTSQQLPRYCKDKLRSCDKHIDLIRRDCMDEHWRGHVCEVGSGSGKLLYRMEKESILTSGIGFEISRSRCEFARTFAQLCDSRVVTIVNDDFLNARLDPGTFDLIIGIDVVLNLVGAISVDHTGAFLDTAHRLLRPGGVLVLELMTCEREISRVSQAEDGVLRTWDRLPEADPFSYCLDEMSLDQAGNLLWKKIFIPRKEGPPSSFLNILKPYSVEEFVDNDSWSFSFRERWSDGDDTAAGEFVVLARKR